MNRTEDMIVKDIQKQAIVSMSLVVNDIENDSFIIGCLMQDDWEDVGDISFGGTMASTLSPKKFSKAFKDKDMKNSSYFGSGEFGIRIDHEYKGMKIDESGDIPEQYADHSIRICVNSDTNNPDSGMILTISIRRYTNSTKYIPVSMEWVTCWPTGDDEYIISNIAEGAKNLIYKVPDETSVAWIRFVYNVVTLEDDTKVIVPNFFSIGSDDMFDVSILNESFEYYKTDASGEMLTPVNVVYMKDDGTVEVNDKEE